MRFRRLCGIFSSDLGIDLGTANTLVYAKGRGIVLNEPSVVAINRVSKKIEAIGREAREMIGRTPRHLAAIEPLKDGVIAHFEMTQKMLQHFIRKAHQGRSWASPSIIVGAPGDTTEVERRAVEEAVYRARAGRVYLVREPLAAAIGAGLPVTDPHGQLIIDIGSGTTDIAVISLAGIAYSYAIRVAGDELDRAIIEYVRQQHCLLIGKRTAESIKLSLGSALELETPLSMEVCGKNHTEGVPRVITVTDREIREALSSTVSIIIDAVRAALEHTPPELSADILDSGIILTGGGALLKNLDKRLTLELGIPVSVAEHPLLSVALGTGKIMSDRNLQSRVLGRGI